MYGYSISEQAFYLKADLHIPSTSYEIFIISRRKTGVYNEGDCGGWQHTLHIVSTPIGSFCHSSYCTFWLFCSTSETEHKRKAGETNSNQAIVEPGNWFQRTIG